MVVALIGYLRMVEEKSFEWESGRKGTRRKLKFSS